jgi:hypothetical protein
MFNELTEPCYSNFWSCFLNILTKQVQYTQESWQVQFTKIGVIDEGLGLRILYDYKLIKIYNSNQGSVNRRKVWVFPFLKFPHFNFLKVQQFSVLAHRFCFQMVPGANPAPSTHKHTDFLGRPS